MKKTLAVITVLAGAVSGYSQGQVDWGDYFNTDFQVTIWSPQTGAAEFIEVQGNSPANFGTGLLPTGADIPAGTQTAYTGVPLGGLATGAVSPADYANGNLWSVQLYAAAGTNVPAILLAPVAGTVANLFTFANNQGLYDVADNPSATIPDVAPGDPATLQLRAWYNGNGAYMSYTAALNAGQPTGQSTTGSEIVGGDIFFPPDLPGPGNLGVSGGITSFSLVMPSGASNLIDVAFTSAAATSKTGFAATGATPNDFWNTYVIHSGSLTNLEFADGTASGSGLTVANANEASTNGASDPMYGVYLYTDGGNIMVTVTNLNQGVYDFYLYGHGDGNNENSVFQLTLGSQIYGSEATTNGSGWLSSVWQEGVQYVRFASVDVSGGQPITITVEPGAGGYAVLSGLQLALVGSMPNFVTQPTNQTVVEGTTATFSVVASGAAPLAYQWLFNNTDISGATNSSYSVIDAQLADAGNYSVVVTNFYGSITSLIATLNIIAPIGTLIDVAFTSASVTGKTGFAAIGVSTNDFWNTYDPFPSPSLLNLEFAEGTMSEASLKIASPVAGGTQNGASDPMYGTCVLGYNISVLITNLAAGAYDIYLYGHGNEDNQNSVFQLTAGSKSYGTQATTNGPGWLSSVWQEGVQYVEFSDVTVSTGQIITITVEPGAAPNFAVLSGLQIAKSGLFPFIVTQPPSQEVFAGASATFVIVAGGPAPLAYQWLFNNAAIPGATNSSYTVTNAHSVDAGNYSVLVSNPYGTVVSQVATLTVSNISIIIQPTSQEVFAGASAILGIVAGGPAPLAYQWLFNNAAISGATNSSYKLTTAESADAGNYSVLVSNAYGSVTSQVVTLTVSNISILTQPVSQEAYQGTGAAFSVVATAGTPLAYQWLFNNADISGATNSSYSVANAQPTDAGNYSVIVTNVYGSLTSHVATLTVTNISILTQPTSQLVFQGKSGTFSVVAIAGTPLAYQWLFNNADISGATNSSYSVRNAQPANAGNYSVIVANPYGRVTSSVAALEVIVPTDIDVAFTSASVTSKTGLAATGVSANDFWNTYDVVNTSDLPNLKYVDGTSSGADLTEVNVYSVSANGSSDPMYGVYVWASVNIILQITNLFPGEYDFYFYGHGDMNNQNGVYQLTAGSQSYGTEATTTEPGWLSSAWQEGVQYVEFSDVTVEAGQTITITVEPGAIQYAVLSGMQIVPSSPFPIILAQPLNQEVNPGASATFSVIAGGTAPLAYQWLFDNADISGATNSTYSVTNAQPANAGNYAVIVTNALGSVTSVVATLSVTGPLTTLIDVAFTSALVTSKTGFAATGMTSGDFWNTYNVDDGSLPELEFVDDTISGAGLAVVNVAYGVSNSGAFDPLYASYLFSLNPVNMAVTVTNLNAGVYNFYLYGHGNYNAENSVFQLSAGSRSYGSEATTTGSGWDSAAWQEGLQYVEFTNVSVSHGQAITIKVEPGGSLYGVLSGLQMAYFGLPPDSPFVLDQPVKQTVIAGVTATFSLMASGAAPLAYQWLLNNAEISGATNSSYSVANAQPANNGNYSVIVTNAYGSVTSAVAALDAIVPAASVIDVAFTDGLVTSKTGFAATGATTNDFWNTCTASLYPGPNYGNGAVPNLKFADGSSSGAGLTLADVDSVYGNGAPDPMYGVYLVNANKNITVTVANLIGGEYDFYLYGHGDYDIEDGIFQLAVGSLSYGSEATTTGSAWDSAAWQEGMQYVEFTDVTVVTGQTVTITAEPGGGGFALISGLQIAVPTVGAGNSPATTQLAQSGRVPVIGPQSLLEASLDSNSNPTLTLYGHPGVSYDLLSTTNLIGGGSWSKVGNVTLTGLSQVNSLGSATNQMQFFKAVQR
jgi:hypothetical protein